MPDTPQSQPDPAPEPEPQPAALAIITGFTPVPRKCERHDGWTPERQKLFIEALADYGSVRAAANSVGLAPEGAYRLRRQPGAEQFAAAWEAALACGIRRIEDALMDRALNGVETPVYSYGKLVGSRIVYNDRLGMFMLRNRAADRFAMGGGARAPDAVGKMELKRLEKQWREEWEAERAREEEEEDREVTAGLVDTFEQMHRRWYGALSPQARAAYRVFRRIEIADSRRGWGEDDAEGYGERWPAEYRAALDAEYDQVFAADRRAKIWQVIDVDGYGVREALAAPEAREQDRPLLPDALSPPPAWKVIDGGMSDEEDDDE